MMSSMSNVHSNGRAGYARRPAVSGPSDSASDKGQMPPTPAVPIRQHKRLAMPKGK